MEPNAMAQMSQFEREALKLLQEIKSELEGINATLGMAQLGGMPLAVYVTDAPAHDPQRPIARSRR
jgi:hypothetical protein